MMTRIVFEPDYSRARVGFWCDNCQLPSLMQVPVLILADEGVTDGYTIASCANCEGEDEYGDVRGR